MEVHGLFPTPVVKFTLGRAFTEAELLHISNLPQRLNDGNTASVDSYVLRNDALRGLQEFCTSSVNEFVKIIYAPSNVAILQITQSWVNYTKENQFHHAHEHPNSFISGVLYIEANKEVDKINFLKKNYKQIKLTTENYNFFNSEKWWFPVETGDLLLFPSELTHSVEAIKQKERISLAFNTFPIGILGSESTLNELKITGIA